MHVTETRPTLLSKVIKRKGKERGRRKRSGTFFYCCDLIESHSLYHVRGIFATNEYNRLSQLVSIMICIDTLLLYMPHSLIGKRIYSFVDIRNR